MSRRQNISDQTKCPAMAGGRLLMAAWLVFFVHGATAQVQRYPADIQPILPAPYSVYLSYYTAEGSNRLSANILF
ncbi:MAG: hypothetical protein RIE59_22145, partial [Imperialibacter sp.]